MQKQNPSFSCCQKAYLNINYLKVKGWKRIFQMNLKTRSTQVCKRNSTTASITYWLSHTDSWTLQDPALSNGQIIHLKSEQRNAEASWHDISNDSNRYLQNIPLKSKDYALTILIAFCGMICGFAFSYFSKTLSSTLRLFKISEFNRRSIFSCSNFLLWISRVQISCIFIWFNCRNIKTSSLISSKNGIALKTLLFNWQIFV